MRRFPRFLLLLLLIPALPLAASDTPAPATVTVAGSLQSELGCPDDWQPGCAATHLSYDADDDVWQGTFTVPAGSWEYKAALNDSWDENYGLHAQRGGANIPLNLTAAKAVKFYYSHETHWITDNQGSVIATAPGSYQHFLGCPGDWEPDCLRSWLQDPDGDGVYTFSTPFDPGRQLRGQGRHRRELDRELWRRRRPERSQHPVHRGSRTAPRRSSPTTPPAMSSPSWRVPHRSSPRTSPSPAASNPRLGCSGDWQPDCAATHLAFDTTDQAWQGTFSAARRKLGVQGRDQRLLGRELRRQRHPQRRQHRRDRPGRRPGQVLLLARDPLGGRQSLQA